jgi:uncharacterized surface protein with fasciclin (FAS1) repeats
MKTLTRRSLAVATAFVATAGLAACSSDSTSSTSASSTAAGADSMATTTAAAAAEDSGLVGPGCAAYAAAVPSGAGSVSGMATAPLATAASSNPLLKTLTAAVSGKLNKKVNLVDTLNGAEFTVFAPVDTAFAKLPKKTVTALSKASGAADLTKILTYHVVAGQLAPDAVAGTQTTVEGGTVKVTGSGDTLKVNGASVICGGVKTANATVYLIDTVLSPPAKS